MSIQKTKKSDFFQSFLETIEEQSKPLFLVAALCGLLIASFFAHKMWVTYREKSTQYDFSPLIEEYEAMIQAKDPEWELLLEKFEKQYEKHSSSSLLAYYLGYKVQILLHQHKHEQALAILEKMIRDLTTSPILPLYQTEQALIQLDMPNDDIRNRGLQSLKTLASDQTNIYRDTAQFYLGRYYWAIDDIESAQNIWQQLIDEQHDEKMAPSPWVQFIQDKLNLLE